MKFVAVAGFVFLAACGSDSDDGGDAADDTSTDSVAADSADGTDDGASTDDVDEGNACPVEGCTITINSVVEAGDEFLVNWSTNFDPDEGRNHIHVYWNTFDPEQVSGNAETEHGVDQGSWVPTAANPEYTTEGAVSTSVRGEATEICVTAADLEHNVLDITVEDCFDISGLVA